MQMAHCSTFAIPAKAATEAIQHGVCTWVPRLRGNDEGGQCAVALKQHTRFVEVEAR
jgi:hypothetical protein